MISQSVSQKVTHKTNFLRFLWWGDRNETPYQGTSRAHIRLGITVKQDTGEISSRMTGNMLRTHENSVCCPPVREDKQLKA